MKILHVCTGNICRSPLGEGITRHLGSAHGLVTASAGTHSYHIGDPPDPRSIDVARRRGVSLSGQMARQVRLKDFRDFDLILAMDAGHLRHLRDMAPRDATAEVELFMQYTLGKAEDVPDPYYGTIQDFEQVFDMIEAGVSSLIRNR